MRADKYYANLLDAMMCRDISAGAVAAVLQISDYTVALKLMGRLDFTLTEAVKLRGALFPEYDLDCLFQKI
jgi:hypothetical protein